MITCHMLTNIQVAMLKLSFRNVLEVLLCLAKSLPKYITKKNSLLKISCAQISSLPRLLRSFFVYYWIFQRTVHWVNYEFSLEFPFWFSNEVILYHSARQSHDGIRDALQVYRTRVMSSHFTWAVDFLQISLIIYSSVHFILFFLFLIWSP